MKLVYKNLNYNSKLKPYIFDASSLVFLQLFNYVFPFLTLPYLATVLGPEKVGLLAFSSSTIAFFTLITDYGFNLSATRQISVSKTDPHKINKIFSVVLIIKIFLLTISFLLLIILINIHNIFKTNEKLFLISFTLVIGQVLNPVWLYQGLSKAKFILVLGLISNLITTVGIFLFVNGVSDFLKVPLLTSLGAIFTGVLSLIIARKTFNVKLLSPTLNEIKFFLVDGFNVFLSSISISLYTVASTFLLGIVTNNFVSVANFSYANKIVQILRRGYSGFSQFLFPLMSQKMQIQNTEKKSFALNLGIIISSFMFFICLALFFSSRLIVVRLFGTEFEGTIGLLKIMAFIPFFISISNFIGVQLMVNLGLQKEFRNIIFKTSLFGLALIYVLGVFFQDFGVAYASLIVEILVVFMLYFKLKIV
jgi:PST family polysaccharide transporter